VSAAERIAGLIRAIPDFPRPGVLFQDLTPVLADGAALIEVADALLAPFAGGFDLVAGVEARGFAFAGAAAVRAGAGLLLIRKGGKLPGATRGVDYELEYGRDRLELHLDQVPPGGRVLIVDDVLATGGTLAAAATLVDAAGGRVAGLSVALEIDGLGGRERLAGRGLHAVARA